ncbi:hypothetical protein BKA62DRAFT_770303 [Auriculariales sp. MPI-PUGE-AT-0066]|nr:hypothetical protein BKA62DRAFT_770303 [Auriculariales sp. MPI-PUGE-AT-0066]
MDGATRAIAGPVNPLGRFPFSAYNPSHFRAPIALPSSARNEFDASKVSEETPQAPLTRARPARDKYDSIQIVNSNSPIEVITSGVNCITSTGRRYFVLVTEWTSATALPETPPEPAGPIQSNQLEPTLSGTVGSIRVIISYETKRAYCWILTVAHDGRLVWLKATAGQLHPDQQVLTGYKLSVRDPEAPSWVSASTYSQYGAPSKAKPFNWQKRSGLRSND